MEQRALKLRNAQSSGNDPRPILWRITKMNTQGHQRNSKSAATKYIGFLDLPSKNEWIRMGNMIQSKMIPLRRKPSKTNARPKKAQISKRESLAYQRRSRLSLTALQVIQMGRTEPVAVIGSILYKSNGHRGTGLVRTCRWILEPWRMMASKTGAAAKVCKDHKVSLEKRKLRR